MNIFYVVDGVRVYSKVEAIHLAKGDLSKIHFSYMEDTWTNVNWSHEPQISWAELLKIRCEQLRDKYKHLTLWYSSGYDSTTVLRAFIENDILFDELLIYDRRDFYDEPEVPFAIEHAKYIKDTFYPNLKITVIRTNFKTLSNFYRDHKDDWFYHPGCNLRVTKTNRYSATMLNKDFLIELDKISDRANILGVDKPKLMLENNKWFTFCPDGGIEDQMSDRQENFFITSDLPELHIKQCYMAIRYFESLPNLSEELVHLIQGKNRTIDGTFKNYYESWNLGMGRQKLYNSHEHSVNGIVKLICGNDENSPQDKKFYDYIKNNDKEIFNIYTSGLKQSRLYDGTSGSLANTSLLSKKYYIKDRSTQ